MTDAMFEFEWLDACDSADALSQATLAAWAIRVRGDSLMTLIDHRTASHRDRVRTPLLPVAEWFVANWWPLWHEPDALSPTHRRSGFETRHDLMTVGDGFVLPSLTMASDAGLTTITATPRRPEHANLQFIASGVFHAARDEFEAGVRTLVDAVIERVGARDTFIHEDWRAINEASADESEFCRAAGMLGLDPFALTEDDAATLVRLWKSTPEPLRADLFGCADGLASDDAIDWITNAMRRLDDARTTDGWSGIARRATEIDGDGAPWSRGFELARQVRRLMDAPDGPIRFDDDWQVPVQQEPVPLDSIDAVVGAESPACVSRRRSTRGVRFLQARAVGDFMARRSPHASLLTAMATERQSHTRSFAAEFLAPASSLRERIGQATTIEPERVDELADEFDVSQYVIAHQVRNHDIATISEFA